MYRCPYIDDVIAARIESNEKLTMASGKLMGTIMTINTLREVLAANEQNDVKCHDVKKDGDGRPEGNNVLQPTRSTIVPFINKLVSFAEEKMCSIR